MPTPITLEEVVNFYQELENLGITIWIDGGWGVDALLGSQTRRHSDLDIAIQQKDLAIVLKLLSAQSYREIRRDNQWNFVLGDSYGREIDIHAFIFNEENKIIDGIKYPEGSLTGIGVLGGYTVKCIPPDHMIQFHTGYPLRDSDFKDVAALCQKFKLPYPKEYLHPFDQVCEKLNLGTPTSPAERIYGGLLHKMWKLTTDQNSYAIKELAGHIDFRNQAIKNNYELSERIAMKFSNEGIPAISALRKDGDSLVEIEGKFFLVYPWVNAKTLPSNQPISDQHGIKIAALISKIHQINLNIFSLPASQEPEFNILSSEEILNTIKNSQDKKAPFAAELKKHQKILLMLNQKYLDSIPLLKKQSVISHGDLDPKNVLWDAEDQPILIDWESARRLNPTHEIINACFDWSGISLENNFNKNLFFKILGVYQKSGGVLDQNLLEPAFYAVASNWIHWMIFNIQRFCESQDLEVLNLSAQQVSQTLRTIVFLDNLIPALLSEIKSQETKK